MGSKKQRYDSILLDVDGTLLDFLKAERAGIKVVLGTYGLKFTEGRLKMYHDINEALWTAFEQGKVTKERLVWERFEMFFANLGIAADGHEVENLYRGQLDESAFLVEGALDLCEYLSRNYDLYVVTNGTSATQYKRLAASGLDRFMKDIFVSEDAGSQKPQKEYFDYCFSRIPKARPERMLLVGDSLQSDIKGGKAAGTDTCWYNPLGEPGSGDIRADYEIKRLMELEGIL